MPTPLRLASFNLENLDDEGDGGFPDGSFDERIRILRPQLERLEADVLCLQEVDGQRDAKDEPRRLRALERLIEGTAYERFHCVSTPGPHPEGVADKHNLVVLSRWPIIGHRTYLQDLVPAP